MRSYHASDARKHGELPPSNDQYRPSVELRRMIDGGSISVHIDPNGTQPPKSAQQDIPSRKNSVDVGRKSLEEHLEKHDDESDFLNSFPLSEGLSSAQAH